MRVSGDRALQAKERASSKVLRQEPPDVLQDEAGGRDLEESQERKSYTGWRVIGRSWLWKQHQFINPCPQGTYSLAGKAEVK